MSLTSWFSELSTGIKYGLVIVGAAVVIGLIAVLITLFIRLYDEEPDVVTSVIVTPDVTVTVTPVTVSRVYIEMLESPEPEIILEF
jgi:cation transporter-like permease